MKVKGLEKWEDKVKVCQLGNGNIQYYVEYEGTDYQVGIYLKGEDRLEVYERITEDFIKMFSKCIHNGRYRLWYGDRQTGESWNATYDVIGEIGRTGGTFRIPILLAKSTSYGGVALLLGSIVRIDRISDRKTVWRHENFHVDKMEIFYNEKCEDYSFEVRSYKDESRDFSVLFRAKTVDKAQRYIDFQTGKRYCL